MWLPYPPYRETGAFAQAKTRGGLCGFKASLPLFGKQAFMQYIMLTVVALALFAGQAFMTLTFQEKEDNDTFMQHVQEKVFDDCFDYYAATSRERGIDKTTIQTCMEKTANWMQTLSAR